MKKIITIGIIAACAFTYASEPSLKLTKSAIASFDREVECLAKNLYHEARGEPTKGQIAVAHVTINRTKSNDYPSDICSVVYQPKQFSWTEKRQKILDWKTFNALKLLSKDVIMGRTTDPTRGALMFHSRSVRPSWANKRPRIIIGSHKFY